MESPKAACARIEDLLERLQGKLSPVKRSLPLLAWACLELGEEDRADALIRDALSDEAMEVERLVLVDALRVQAMIWTRQQRWDEAVGALEEALTLTRAMPYPYAEAKALYSYGQLHVARDESEQAREKYEAALAICARMGEGMYRPHIERALQQLS
jgi:tetratricopeptide (TPR) repeat protein